MTNNRLLNLSIILLIAITLLGGITFVLYKYILVPSPDNSDEKVVKPPTVQQLSELSVETGDITTNLKDNRYAVINFTIIVENKKAKDELTLGMFLVKNEIIRALSSLTAEELGSEEGINALEARLTTGFNSFLQAGKVVRVVTTNKLFQ